MSVCCVCVCVCVCVVTVQRWQGKCWYMYNYAKYEFNVEFEVCAIPLSLMNVIHDASLLVATE